MSFPFSHRALLRGILAGALVLTGTACSRSDRTESGRDNQATAGYRAMERDTTNNASQQLDSRTLAGADTIRYEPADETADEQVIRP